MSCKSKGIRIKDKAENGAVSTQLNDILKECYGGGGYLWAIQEAKINGYKGTSESIMDLEEEAGSSQFGRPISWGDLCALGNDVFQFIDLVLVASKDPENNKWIQEPEKMYETPDVYIEMFDSSFWEVFSKDHAFINRLAHKFKDVQFLDSDFLEKEKS